MNDQDIPRGGCVIGIDIGGTSLRLALAYFDGNIVGRWSARTADSRDPDEVVRLIRTGVDALLAEYAIPIASLRAIAAGVPGITDVEQGIVIATSYLMGWRDVPLRTLLQNEFGVRAAIDNDVNMAAIGERFVGAATDVDNFVFLAIGTGIGAGLMLDGELYRGEQWSAGEIGYMLVPGVSEKVVERGEPGALEAIAGGAGIEKQWQDCWDPGVTALSREASATEILDRAVPCDALACDALTCDALACAVMERTSRVLAYAIGNVSLMLNCPLFLLGGTIGMHAGLGDAVRAKLAEMGKRFQPRVITSSLGVEAQLAGAVYEALAIAKAGRDGQAD